MQVKFYSDVEKFAVLVQKFLLSHEAENNLLIGILNALKKDINTYSKTEKPILIIVEKEDSIQLVSIRTPPYNQLISYTDNLESIDSLVDKLGEVNEELPGVLGFKAGVLKFAQNWSQIKSVDYSLDQHERIYRLEKVNPSTLGNRQVTKATSDDKDTILEMMKNFILEALPDSLPQKSKPEIEASQRRMEKALENNLVYVLKENNEVVSMAKKAQATPNGQIINAVYTYPDKRRRGYATEVVARVSQSILDSGKKYCFLFTDLANPTSNKIYQTIGYRPIIDMDFYKFKSRK